MFDTIKLLISMIKSSETQTKLNKILIKFIVVLKATLDLEKKFYYTCKPMLVIKPHLT